jgi:hypothetical protein
MFYLEFLDFRMFYEIMFYFARHLDCGRIGSNRQRQLQEVELHRANKLSDNVKYLSIIRLVVCFFLIHSKTY